jgi:hypothetical protein
MMRAAAAVVAAAAVAAAVAVAAATTVGVVAVVAVVAAAVVAALVAAAVVAAAVAAAVAVVAAAVAVAAVMVVAVNARSKSLYEFARYSLFIHYIVLFLGWPVWTQHVAADRWPSRALRHRPSPLRHRLEQESVPEQYYLH